MGSSSRLGRAPTDRSLGVGPVIGLQLLHRVRGFVGPTPQLDGRLGIDGSVVSLGPAAGTVLCGARSMGPWLGVQAVGWARRLLGLLSGGVGPLTLLAFGCLDLTALWGPTPPPDSAARSLNSLTREGLDLTGACGQIEPAAWSLRSFSRLLRSTAYTVRSVTQSTPSPARSAAKAASVSLGHSTQRGSCRGMFGFGLRGSHWVRAFLGAWVAWAAGFGFVALK